MRWRGVGVWSWGWRVLGVWGQRQCGGGGLVALGGVLGLRRARGAVLLRLTSRDGIHRESVRFLNRPGFPGGS